MNYESSAVLKQCATTSLSSQCTVPQLFDSVKAEPEEAASSDFQQSVSAESDCFSTTTTTTTDLLEIKPERQLLEIKPERQSPQQAWAPPNFHHYPKPSPAYNAQLPFGVSPVECSYGYQPEMSSPNYEGDYHPNIYSYPVRQAQPPQPAAAVVFTEPISVHSNSSSAFSDTNSPHESPTESTFPPAKAVMICKVCGDKASGYHYGVTSCEGCKGFFRRSIQKATMYKCLRGGDCQVQRMNRNRCQACRMRKCQEVGMSKNSVRTSRSNRRSTIREDSSDSDRAEVSSTTSPEPLEYNDNPFLIAIFKAHDANTPFRDAVSYDRQQLRILNILPETPNEDERRCVGWKLLAEALVPDIRSVIEFVKLIPDFAYLSGNDQCSLLKMQFFGVFLVRYASGFTSEGLQLSEDRLVDMRTLQVVYGMGLTREMLMFADKLNDLKPTGLTIALLSALFLASPKRGVFESTDMIINLRMRIMDAFDNHLRKQFASSLHARALFMELIEDLQNRTALHDREHDFLRYHPSPMSMPPLYAEIYRAEPCPINYNTQIE